MSAAEEVANLPGGADLSDLMNKVNGCSPETIRGIATRWRGIAGKVSEYAGALSTAVGNVDDAWQGESANDFDKYMRKYRKAGDALHDALSKCADSLGTAATAVESAKSAVGGIAGNLLTNVAAYRNDNPKADKKDLDPHITSMAAKAASDARVHVNAAETAVAAAMKGIGEHLDDRPITFSKPYIDEPANESFVPGQGPTVKWEWTPLQKAQQTTLAGVNGGGGGSSWSSGQAAGGGGSGGSSGYGSGGAAQAIPYAPGSGTGAEIVAAAQKHIGKPYVWGANGPSAFDCSGLVYYSLNQSGIKIGDTTAEGYKQSGQPITGAPQPGDIVFFGDPATHVGIYIGDGKMINAPHTGALVRVDPVAGKLPITYRRFM